MNAPLSPAAMIVRAGMLHDDGTHPLNADQMRDMYRMLDLIPGDEAAIDAALIELEGETVTLAPVPAIIHGQRVSIHVHGDAGEFHWSATDPDGTLRGYGTDFHATPNDATADAVQMLALLLA